MIYDFDTVVTERVVGELIERMCRPRPPMITEDQFYLAILSVVPMCSSIASTEILVPYWKASQLITGGDINVDEPIPDELTERFIKRMVDLLIPAVEDMCLVENWVQAGKGWLCTVILPVAITGGFQ